MELGLRGRSVLVSAASRGIGRAAALGFLQEGASATICGRDAGALEQTRGEFAADFGDRICALQADVTDPQQQAALYHAATERFGPVEVLVNNAGGPPPGTHDAVTDEDWQRAFEGTVQSAVRLTNLALPAMKAARWGRIINISSYSVRQPIDNMMLSNSLRLSVLGWAKTLAAEVAAAGILVNTVCPGWTDTDRVASVLNAQATATGRSAEALRAELAATVPIGRTAAPAEIANAIVFLASDAASYITGVALPVDGGISRAI